MALVLRGTLVLMTRTCRLGTLSGQMQSAFSSVNAWGGEKKGKGGGVLPRMSYIGRVR